MAGPGGTVTCPLCGTHPTLRPDGRTLRNHTFSTQLLLGGARTWLCGVTCSGGGLTLEAARQLAARTQQDAEP